MQHKLRHFLAASGKGIPIQSVHQMRKTALKDYSPGNIFLLSFPPVMPKPIMVLYTLIHISQQLITNRGNQKL